MHRKSLLFLLMTISGGVTFGYNISIIASALPQIQQQFALSSNLISLIAGLVFAGMAIAKLTMPLFNDFLGRRKTLITAAILFILSTIIVILAKSGNYIIIGRTLQGFCSGLLMFTTSLYIVEVANDKNRGKYTALYQLSFTIGLFLANIIGMYFYNINWRYNFIYLIVLCLLFLITMIILPCSPRFLLRNNRESEARAALLITHSASEIDQIIDKWKLANLSTKVANVLQKQYLKALSLVVVITCLNQLTGINAILQTSTMLISNAGLEKHAALLGSIGITAINVIGTLIGISIVDNFPRNKVIGICGIAIAFTHLVIAVNFFSGLNSPVILIGGLMLFILSFAIGPGIIIWLVFSEYLPLAVRSQGIAIAGFINAIAGFLISSGFLYISNRFGLSYVFLTCCVCSFIYAIIPLLYLPNTTGKDIEDFNSLFARKSN
jgi:sugar porter (SP) family MFS transporter